MLKKEIEKLISEYKEYEPSSFDEIMTANELMMLVIEDLENILKRNKG